VTVTGAASLERAGPGDLAFLANPKYAPHLAGTRAAVVIVDAKAARPAGVTLLRAAQPYLAFARALQFLVRPEPPAPGAHPGALVDPAARVSPGATVMPGAFVGPGAEVGAGTVIFPNATLLARARVGRDCLIYPGVAIREDCAVGDRVILHHHVSIGADGYGFAQDGAMHVKIPQLGNVVVGDDVEIGAGTCVDRAALGSTVIGRGTKIDNLVQIGHGCQVGEDCLIVAQSGMAGSAVLEDRVTVGARGGVLGHLTVGAGAVIYSRTHVTKSVPPKTAVSGNPARPHREQLRHEAQLARLAGRVAALEAELERLKKKRK
jgi:UDP-3-O-[3-hydroxymyristoyl] glucosamine N-acyltransferase